MSARILVVCTGNVCRSPFVEHLLRARLDAEFGPGHGIRVESRGTEAVDGAPMDPQMLPFLQEALTEIDEDSSDLTVQPETDQPGMAELDAAPHHEARRLTAADIESAELVVTATRVHRQAVSRLTAQGLARTFTLRQLTALVSRDDSGTLPDEPADRVQALTTAAARQRGIVPISDSELDIDDPYGAEPEVYRHAVDQLLAGVDALVAVLAGRQPPIPAGATADGAGSVVEQDRRDAEAARARSRRRRRRVSRVVAVFAVLVLAAVCWVGVRGALAYRHLRHVQAEATQLKSLLEAGRTTGAGALGIQVAANARAAHRLTSDPVWGAAQRLPWIGADLRAAGTVAQVSDRLGRTSITPLIPLTTLLTPQATAGSAAGAGSSGTARFATDIGLLGQQRGALTTAATSLAASKSELQAVDTDGLIGAESTAIRTLTTQIGQASTAVGAAARAAVVLPAMFDTPTPKTYLLLFQNPAEARSLGGIAGAYAIVRADHGRLTLTSTGAGSAIPEFDAPVLKLEPAYTDIFGNQPSRYFLDTTQTPYFPDAARLASTMWRLHSGQTVDGVISTDPVMLSYLLAVTGPVQIPGDAGTPAMTLTAANAVPYLLNGVYRTVADPNKQNVIFARTTGAVFAALSDGRGDPVGLVKALNHGASEGRLFVWDSSAVVTSGVAGTALAGIPSPGTNDRPTVGLYLDDGTGSKMSWYLRRSTSLSVSGSTGGYRTVTVSLTLRSVAPKSGLPAYVSGGAFYGVPVGTARTIVYVLAPVDGSVVSSQIDGADSPLGSGELHGRNIGEVAVDVAAGDAHTVTFTLLAPTGTALPWLLLQPMAHS